MSQNIIILSGSPRKGATTDRLVDAFVEGAEASGKNVTVYRTADLKIGGCLGCNHCFAEQGVCVQKDDMLPVLEQMRKSDAIVFASPVYYFNFTAQLKLAIDRTYALIKEGGAPIKRAALLMTCGADADAAEPSIATFRKISSLQKWDEAGIVIVPNLHQPDEIVGRAELEQARKLGQSI